MPDKTVSPDASSSEDSLPNDIIEAVADSTAVSVGEQPAILANLALANLIFNTCLAQQDAIVNQQIIFQVKLAAMAKSIQMLLAVNVADPQAVETAERIARNITEMFDQLQAKVEERLATGQSQFEQKMNQLRAQAASPQPEQS